MFQAIQKRSSDLLSSFRPRYANLCNQVFAPSESVASVLRQRGVVARIDVVPTGVHLEEFDRGSGAGFRAAMDIPENAFVVGHVGRLAPEKNLGFLTQAISLFLKIENRATNVRRDSL